MNETAVDRPSANDRGVTSPRADRRSEVGYAEDSRRTAEVLSRYKRRYAATVNGLVNTQQLPQIMEDRLPVLSGIPLLVTKDYQQPSSFDRKTGNIYLYTLYSDLNRDHEMTHPLLLPGVQWEPLNEGIVQKAARLINTNMQHPDRPRRDEKLGNQYEPNEQLVDEISRITGLTLNEIIIIATNPPNSYNTLDEIKRTATEDPDKMVAQAESNEEEINNRSRITINGKTIGIIDYGKQIEGNALVDYALSDPQGYQLTPQEAKERQEKIIRKVVAAYKAIPSLVPVPA